MALTLATRYMYESVGTLVYKSVYTCRTIETSPSFPDG